MKKTKRHSDASKMSFHPVAEMFPLMTGPEFDGLVEDIRTFGQRHKILKTGSQIIDGRNRYRACEVLKIKPIFEEWDGKGSLAEISCSLNFHRRHLTISQRAATGAIAEEEFAKEADARMKSGGKEKFPEGQKGQARDLAAKACGVNARYISDAKLVRHQNPELFRKLIDGDVTISQAKRAVHRAAKTQKAASIKLPPLDASACKIIHGDCIEQLELLPSKSVRLVFADSPYNIGIDYGKGAKADLLSDQDFVKWCKRWIAECARVLTADGSIFVMMDRKYTSHIGVALADAGLHQRNIIIWNEDFGNHTNHNFTNCARFIHYHTRDAQNFVFDSDAIRVPSARQTKYRDKRAEPAGKVPSNVWAIPRLVDNATERLEGFPTQLPIALVERIILICSEPGDTVVDPFTGSGTTAAAALRHGRKFIGFDFNAKNVAAAKRRVSLELSSLRQQKGAA